ncbi:hypothetical protein JL721_11541 [Aureococcus anophagefferens]|nr:hypothetical protein JL721_11541 [Aureococcus anophagefferens]
MASGSVCRNYLVTVTCAFTSLYFLRQQPLLSRTLAVEGGLLDCGSCAAEARERAVRRAFAAADARDALARLWRHGGLGRRPCARSGRAPAQAAPRGGRGRGRGRRARGGARAAPSSRSRRGAAGDAATEIWRNARGGGGAGGGNATDVDAWAAEALEGGGALDLLGDMVPYGLFLAVLDDPGRPLSWSRAQAGWALLRVLDARRRRSRRGGGPWPCASRISRTRRRRGRRGVARAPPPVLHGGRRRAGAASAAAARPRLGGGGGLGDGALGAALYAAPEPGWSKRDEERVYALNAAAHLAWVLAHRLHGDLDGAPEVSPLRRSSGRRGVRAKPLAALSTARGRDVFRARERAPRGAEAGAGELSLDGYDFEALGLDNGANVADVDEALTVATASDVSQFLDDVAAVLGRPLPWSIKRTATLALALSRVAWHHVAYSAPNVYGLLSVELLANGLVSERWLRRVAPCAEINHGRAADAVASLVDRAAKRSEALPGAPAAAVENGAAPAPAAAPAGRDARHGDATATDRGAGRGALSRAHGRAPGDVRRRPRRRRRAPGALRRPPPRRRRGGAPRRAWLLRDPLALLLLKATETLFELYVIAVFEPAARHGLLGLAAALSWWRVGVPWLVFVFVPVFYASMLPIWLYMGIWLLACCVVPTWLVGILVKNLAVLARSDEAGDGDEADGGRGAPRPRPRPRRAASGGGEDAADAAAGGGEDAADAAAGEDAAEATDDRGSAETPERARRRRREALDRLGVVARDAATECAEVLRASLTCVGLFAVVCLGAPALAVFTVSYLVALHGFLDALAGLLCAAVPAGAGGAACAGLGHAANLAFLAFYWSPRATATRASRRGCRSSPRCAAAAHGGEPAPLGDAARRASRWMRAALCVLCGAKWS